jgi:hypothetical protein
LVVVVPEGQLPLASGCEPSGHVGVVAGGCSLDEVDGGGPNVDAGGGVGVDDGGRAFLGG